MQKTILIALVLAIATPAAPFVVATHQDAYHQDQEPTVHGCHGQGQATACPFRDGIRSHDGKVYWVHRAPDSALTTGVNVPNYQVWQDTNVLRGLQVTWSDMNENGVNDPGIDIPPDTRAY